MSPSNDVKRTVLRWLHANPAGGRMPTIAAEVGMCKRQVTAALYRLAKDDLASVTGRRRLLYYYAREHAPADMPPAKPAKRSQGAAPKRKPAPAPLLRHDDTPAIMRDGVKVTICPSGRDQRYTFHPPPGWVGGFRAEWLRLRGGRP